MHSQLNTIVFSLLLKKNLLNICISSRQIRQALVLYHLVFCLKKSRKIEQTPDLAVLRRKYFHKHNFVKKLYLKLSKNLKEKPGNFFLEFSVIYYGNHIFSSIPPPSFKIIIMSKKLQAVDL